MMSFIRVTSHVLKFEAGGDVLRVIASISELDISRRPVYYNF